MLIVLLVYHAYYWLYGSRPFLHFSYRHSHVSFLIANSVTVPSIFQWKYQVFSRGAIRNKKSFIWKSSSFRIQAFKLFERLSQLEAINFYFSKWWGWYCYDSLSLSILSLSASLPRPLSLSVSQLRKCEQSKITLEKWWALSIIISYHHTVIALTKSNYNSMSLGECHY